MFYFQCCLKHLWSSVEAVFDCGYWLNKCFLLNLLLFVTILWRVYNNILVDCHFGPQQIDGPSVLMFPEGEPRVISLLWHAVTVFKCAMLTLTLSLVVFQGIIDQLQSWAHFLGFVRACTWVENRNSTCSIADACTISGCCAATKCHLGLLWCNWQGCPESHTGFVQEV